MRNPVVLVSMSKEMYSWLDRKRKPASMQDYIRYILDEWITECNRLDGLQLSFPENDK